MAVSSSIKEVADRIKETRIAAGVTQAELGRRLGISYSGVSKIERGTYNVGLETIKKIAKALNVTPDYLIFGSEDPRAEINRLFDQLTSDQQESVLAFLRTMLGDRAEV